jgi:excinuclease ABC subunit C
MNKFKFISKENIPKLPEEAGVYAFFATPKRNCGDGLLYIGKAINIRERVKNHFLQPTFRDNLFIDQINNVGYIKTDSEIEALLLEAKLIKKYQPKFNVVWRDDKNYFYVGMTNEAYPQIFITHQPKLSVKSYRLKVQHVGPFVDGKALKETLKFLRKVFPFRSCRFVPKKSCLWYHLGRCPAPCTLESGVMDVPAIKKIVEKEARKDAASLFKILSGKKSQVLKNLKKEMAGAAQSQDFEKAKKIRDKIFSLEKVLQNARIFSQLPISQNSSWPKAQEILSKITGVKTISRIEAYDISNIQGQLAVGSMVVFVEGLPDKSLYRKFKIHIAGKPDDFAMLKEVLTRRFGHPEWNFPNLILIDGGKGQLNIAINSKLQNPNYKNIKILAIAKRNNELYIEGKKKPILLKILPREISDLILYLRDEAHRFAIAYHKKLRQVDFAPKV